MVLCQEVLHRHKDQLLLCHHDIVLFVIPFLNEFYAFIYSGAVIVFVVRKKFCIMMHAGFGFSASVFHSLASRKRYALWSFFFNQQKLMSVSCFGHVLQVKKFYLP